MPKAALPTLIKLAIQAVEKAQKALADNREAQAIRHAQIATWQQEAAAAFASGITPDTTVQALQAAGLFNDRARLMVATLEREIDALLVTEQTLKATLTAAYAKQKRYEILAEQQAKAAKLAQNKKTQAALDEVAKRGLDKVT